MDDAAYATVGLGLQKDSGWKFNSKHFGLSFGVKNGLRFHDILLVWGVSSQNSSGFYSQNSS